MSREELPARREAETFEFEFGGQRYVATAGYYKDGRVGEIFLRNSKQNSELDVWARDAAILLSLARQFGCELQTIQHALTKNADGSSSGPLGIALEMAMVRGSSVVPFRANQGPLTIDGKALHHPNKQPLMAGELKAGDTIIFDPETGEVVKIVP